MYENDYALAETITPPTENDYVRAKRCILNVIERLGNDYAIDENDYVFDQNDYIGHQNGYARACRLPYRRLIGGVSAA